MEHFIKKLTADRRLSQRHTLKAGLRVRVRRSETAERRAESENLSQRGVFFATDLPDQAVSLLAIHCVAQQMPRDFSVMVAVGGIWSMDWWGAQRNTLEAAPA